VLVILVPSPNSDGCAGQVRPNIVQKPHRYGFADEFSPMALSAFTVCLLSGSPALPAARAAELRQRIAAGEVKAKLAREFGIDRTTIYRYAQKRSELKV